MGKFERRLERQLNRLLWSLIALPFQLIFLLFRWLLSDKHLNADGYVVTKSKSARAQYEHRQVAEEILGRRLEAWEVVHHINGRRNDNSPSNLCVMARIDHDRYHKWYDWVVATYKKYPRRTTQLKKLRESFNGTILSEYSGRRTGT